MEKNSRIRKKLSVPISKRQLESKVALKFSFADLSEQNLQGDFLVRAANDNARQADQNRNKSPSVIFQSKFRTGFFKSLVIPWRNGPL